MYRSITCLVLTQCLPLLVLGQSILAGQVSQSDLYYDYDPDTLIYSYTDPDHVNHFPLDMNDDSVVDFELVFKDSWGQMGWVDCYVKIIPLNGNQVANTRTDTCLNDSLEDIGHYLIPETFDAGDLIDSTQTWRNEEQFLKYRNSLVNDHNCIGGVWTEVIIGVKIFYEAETLYGWIKLSDMYSSSDYSTALIEEFALNRPSVSIEELEIDRNVYPNPTRGIVYIGQPFKQISVFNSLGADVTDQLRLDKNLGVLDMSLLSKGLYYCNMINANEASGFFKVLKQ